MKGKEFMETGRCEDSPDMVEQITNWILDILSLQSL